jgi:hypothetical protein
LTPPTVSTPQSVGMLLELFAGSYGRVEPARRKKL